MGKNIIAGIDAGTSTIKVVVAEVRNNGQDLHILSANKKNSKGIKKGYVTNLEETAESIKEAIREAEIVASVPVKSAFISAGGISLGSTRSKDSIIISRADGTITDNDVNRLISQCENNLQNTNNKRVLQSFPISFKIDGNPVLGHPTGMKGKKLEAEILFITCLDQHLNDLVKAVELSDVAVEDIIASPIAASMVTLNKYQKEAGCVLANIGSGTVSIVVFEEGTPVSLEVFPIGSINITNDIALGLQISLEEAERLKTEYGADIQISSRKKLSDIINARLNDIFELIESHLKKINRNKLLPAGIILTGGGASLLNLEKQAKASLSLPAEIVTSLQINKYKNITVSKRCAEQVLENPEWSVALGLCLAGTNEDAKPMSKAKDVLENWIKTLLP